MRFIPNDFGEDLLKLILVRRDTTEYTVINMFTVFCFRHTTTLDSRSQGTWMAMSVTRKATVSNVFSNTTNKRSATNAN